MTCTAVSLLPSCSCPLYLVCCPLCPRLPGLAPAYLALPLPTLPSSLPTLLPHLPTSPLPPPPLPTSTLSAQATVSQLEAAPTTNQEGAFGAFVIAGRGTDCKWVVSWLNAVSGQFCCLCALCVSLTAPAFLSPWLY